MRELLHTFAHPGTVQWIGLRPERRVEVVSVDSVAADVEKGLIGDRFQGRAGAKRQVTLIQHEHLVAVATLLGRTSPIDPALVRRNIVVSGINLQALKNCIFNIGEAIFYGTGNCAPCSRMEEVLGTSGYNAMRGHGGITAYVVTPGIINIGDEVRVPPTTDI